MTTERDLRNQMAYARKEAIEQGMAEGRAVGFEVGRAEGREEGRAEGSRDKAIEIARNLKGMGMTIEDIAEIVGLETEIIDNL